MRAWFAQHARAVRGTLAAFAQAPLGTLFNAAVIALALALPAALWQLAGQLQGASHHAGAAPQLSVFMTVEASRDEARAIEKRLRQAPGVARVEFVPREQALADLRKQAGLEDALDSLGGNPLPDAFVITLADAAPAGLETLRDELRQWPKVAHVALDALWARRLDAALRIARGVAAALLALLGIALVAATFNTIRLQILTRRDEIAVLQAIGATGGYVRRPFLYYGALLGLAGGLLAWLLLAAATWAGNQGLAPLAALYGAEWRLVPLPAGPGGALMAIATGLGWLGAWLSVSRHLQRD
ncbi:MAG: permease-like cell division protein FtsX [Burkholderiales bacterium]